MIIPTYNACFHTQIKTFDISFNLNKAMKYGYINALNENETTLLNNILIRYRLCKKL